MITERTGNRELWFRHFTQQSH